MFFFKKKVSSLAAVCDGIIRSLETYPDPAISQKLLGDGYSILPEKGRIVAPADGEVMMVFPTVHALGLKCGSYEILIHIGVDTVKLNGQGFISHVKVGDAVKAGQLLVEVDLPTIEKHPEVLSSATAVILTGSDKKVVLTHPDTHVSAGQADVARIQ